MRRPHLTLRRQIVDPQAPRPVVRSPAELLGPNHPLARGDRLRRDLWRQSLTTAAAVLLGALATASGRVWGLPLVVVASIVEVGLGVALVLHAGLHRERARELIIAGRELPLLVLQREQRRLQRPRLSRSLARALEGLACAAERWPTLVPTSRPVFDPHLVRPVAPRLRTIAARLRANRADVRTVARVQWLLTSGASPLYGRTPEELRGELGRIEAELDSADSVQQQPERPIRQR